MLASMFMSGVSAAGLIIQMAFVGSCLEARGNGALAEKKVVVFFFLLLFFFYLF